VRVYLLLHVDARAGLVDAERAEAIVGRHRLLLLLLLLLLLSREGCEVRGALVAKVAVVVGVVVGLGVRVDGSADAKLWEMAIETIELRIFIVFVFVDSQRPVLLVVLHRLLRLVINNDIIVRVVLVVRVPIVHPPRHL
jgi:hypothetical protein